MNPVLAFIFWCGVALAAGAIIGAAIAGHAVHAAEWSLRRVWFRVRQRLGMCRNKYRNP